ncbi:glycosyltransferase family 2 protein [Pontibacter sp. E15-1]|uniref:glycosyltransferase family 2 protein n=1 Tax=Pontibacter sp. E15-1 TaxID=2919918 RepID=UPI001F4F7C6D|nr:glycosyltransferase family 2 protein [Pontibacter sp. E15-1]MCJ8164122.1 glycosyltransferase family 2 protein [Pontibacter sp. E15-1]
MNPENISFSVIIPLYNKEEQVAESIASALGQTYPAFEVIVVNDGSTDRSLAAAQSLSDHRLTVYSKKNGGVSDARNFGVSKSSHPLVAFLDADDLWEPNYLTEMAKLIEAYPACGMYGSAYRIVKTTKHQYACTSLPQGILHDFFKVRLQHHIMRTSATVVQKNALESVGGFPVGMIGGEDDYTWAKIAVKHKAAFTPKVLVTYNHIYSTVFFRKGKLDTCKESWFDFYESGNFYRNEFIASKAIHAAIRYALGSPQAKSVAIEQQTRFTVLSKKKWRYLYILNRVPYGGIRLYIAFKNAYRSAKSRWLTMSAELKGGHFEQAPST